MGKSGRKWVISMFMGEYQHNLDAKGRIIVPAKFRDDLGANMVVTRGLDGCLTIYTMDQWKTIFDQLRKLPTTKKESRMYIHMLTAKAAECQLDNQGRILLPANLIAEAKLSKECIILGVADHVEIWAKDRWENYYESASDNFEEIAETITDFLV